MSLWQRTRPPLPLLLGFTAFLAVVGYLVAASFVKPNVAEFAPTPPGTVPAAGSGPDTVTIDASDEQQWRFYSFRRGLVSPPDTADWDLRFRRYHVIASGRVADLGRRSLTEEIPDTIVNPSFEEGAAAAGAALDHWYRYSFITHLLKPDGRIFMIETRGGARARVEFLSYYCPGSQPGCLTFRWAWMKTAAAATAPLQRKGSTSAPPEP